MKGKQIKTFVIDCTNFMDFTFKGKCTIIFLHLWPNVKAMLWTYVIQGWWGTFFSLFAEPVLAVATASETAIDPLAIDGR